MSVNSYAYSGSFVVDCLGLRELSCSDLISDIVSTKFTQKYPPKRYQITLIAIQTKNGITASHVSVAPKIHSTSGFTVLGTRGWVVTKIAEDLSEAGLLKVKLETARESVQSMMEFCENSLDCAVFNDGP